MNKNTCIVVIPIHKPDPSSYEIISFRQCFKILGTHPICIIAPQGLNLERYRAEMPEFNIKYIHPKWQSDLISYNKLKLSRFFYRLFDQYEFLLTYELDAFIFKDELSYWCAQNYDYIGAPWFEGYDVPGNHFKGVGNSGFSLRKISSIQKVLRSFYYPNPIEENYVYRYGVKGFLIHAYRWFLNQFRENHTIQEYYTLNEDYFYGILVPAEYKMFNIAPVEKAMKFSFEVKPEFLFEQNNEQLPMGCHAWWRYNLGFWKPYIESFGYSL